MVLKPRIDRFMRFLVGLGGEVLPVSAIYEVPCLQLGFFMVLTLDEVERETMSFRYGVAITATLTLNVQIIVIRDL